MHRREGVIVRVGQMVYKTDEAATCSSTMLLALL